MADDTGGCFKGDKIDLTSLRTQEQQDMMKALGDALQGMIGQGATPYGGQINAPYDPAMLSAMNMMMQVGGQGPYQPFNFPTMGPQGGAPGGLPGWNEGAGDGLLRGTDHPLHGTGPGAPILSDSRQKALDRYLSAMAMRGTPQFQRGIGNIGHGRGQESRGTTKWRAATEKYNERYGG